MSSPSTFSRIYQHDPLGRVGARGYRNTTAWMANVFTAQANETLGAVGFYTTDANVSYEIECHHRRPRGPPRAPGCRDPRRGTKPMRGSTRCP